MKTLIAVLIGSSMVLSFSSEAKTCEDVWDANPQSKSEMFLTIAKTNPEITDSVRESSISVCESAEEIGALGGSDKDVLRMVSAASRKLPDEGRISMAFMAIEGWGIGNSRRK